MTDERRARMEEVLRYRQNDLTVVLENVFDPHNVSAVLRSCDAIGIMEIYIVNTLLPPFRKFGERSSSGAYKWVKVHQFTNVNECMKAVRKNYEQILSTHLSSEAKSLYDLNLTKPTALVFGNEVEGLSEEMLSHCDGNYVIPLVGMSKSLNISVACAISIYEAYRQKQQAGHYAAMKISQEEHTMLKSFWKMRDL